MTEIEAVAHVLCGMKECIESGCAAKRLGRAHVVCMEYEEAERMVEAYESTPRQQARQAVVEALMIWFREGALVSPEDLRPVKERCARLAELESGDD